MDRVIPFGGPAPCERCGGEHTSRQRCPADPIEGAAVDVVHTIAAARSGSRPAALPTQPVSDTTRTVLAWWGGGIGSVILWVCVLVAGVLIATLAEAGTDVLATSAGIGVTIAIGIVLGMLPLWYTARVFAKINFAVLSLTLVTGGLGFMVAAPVVRSMNTRDLAEYTAFSSFLTFGAIATMLGVVLGVWCVRWSMTRKARRMLSGWSRMLGSAYGVLLMLSGIGTLLAFQTLVGGEASTDIDGNEFSVVEQSIAFAVIVALTLVPGLILTYHGISSSMGEGSGAFRPPVAAVGVLVFGAVLVVGQLNMRMESPIAAPMPPLHVLAAIVPGITLAALSGRGSMLRGEPVRGLTWRQVTLAAAISMSVGVAIALYVELSGSYAAVALLMVNNGSFEFASDGGEAWNYITDYPDLFLSENEQFVAGLFAASVLAPLAEEFGKSLGVRFMMRPISTRAQCFLLGAFAGAGFGFLEALMYGLAGVSDDLSAWWEIMLLRGGSTSLHVICTGLAGVGWWYFSRARRHGVAMGLFGIAVAIHAAWNAFATVLYSRILFLDTIDNTLLDVIAYGIIAVTSVAMIAAIPWVARRLRERVAPVAGTPIASMAPWLG